MARLLFWGALPIALGNEGRWGEEVGGRRQDAAPWLAPLLLAESLVCSQALIPFELRRHGLRVAHEAAGAGPRPGGRLGASAWFPPPILAATSCA